MKTRLPLTIMLAVPALVSTRASCAESKDYKGTIEALISNREAIDHPEFAKLHFSFFEPKAVLYGERKQQRLAVRCDWFPDGRDGEPFLMVGIATFLVDLGMVYEVARNERIVWVGGDPVREKEQPSTSSDPTRDSGTISAVQGPQAR
jgi:hypothetical protein